MPNKSFSRAVRKNHIHQGFVNRWSNGKREEITSSQAARAIMLEPSAHIRMLLAELVRDGLIVARKVEDNRNAHLVRYRMNLETGQKEIIKGENNFTVFYQLSPLEIERLKSEEREVTVKSGGKVVGQLRMF